MKNLLRQTATRGTLWALVILFLVSAHHPLAAQQNKKQRRQESFPDWKDAEFQTLKIRQTWHQEPKGFDRVAHVSQPKNAKSDKLPVILFFHGAGGSAMNSMRQWKSIYKTHIIVSAQGYRRTWNVHGEPSQAPDVEFFRELRKKMKSTIKRADMDNVALIGYSNGSGFIHRLLIEIDEPFSKTNILMAASMIEQQYHDGSFWKPSKGTDKYDTKVKPASGRTIHYFHGTQDKVVPYAGGNRGRFPHVSALETAFAWAKANGYQGKMRTEKNGDEVAKGVVKISYPETEVYHYQVVEGNHGMQPHRRATFDIVHQLLDVKKN